MIRYGPHNTQHTDAHLFSKLNCHWVNAIVIKLLQCILGILSQRPSKLFKVQALPFFWPFLHSSSSPSVRKVPAQNNIHADSLHTVSQLNSLLRVTTLSGGIIENVYFGHVDTIVCKDFHSVLFLSIHVVIDASCRFNVREQRKVVTAPFRETRRNDPERKEEEREDTTVVHRHHDYLLWRCCVGWRCKCQ